MPSTILVADDCSIMRRMVREALEPEGHEVIEASDGRAALAALERTTAGLVITDMIMPEIDGLALIRALRVSDRYRKTPILMLTVEGDQTVKQEGRAAGASAWVVKPFRPDQLRQAVHHLLEHARS
jgi:two-component system, chemotaxis family, chemotaxis protein CheY